MAYLLYDLNDETYHDLRSIDAGYEDNYMIVRNHSHLHH